MIRPGLVSTALKLLPNASATVHPVLGHHGSWTWRARVLDCSKVIGLPSHDSAYV